MQTEKKDNKFPLGNPWGYLGGLHYGEKFGVIFFRCEKDPRTLKDEGIPGASFWVTPHELLFQQMLDEHL